MTESKLVGVGLIIFSLGWLWWLLFPLVADKYLIPTQFHSVWIGGGWAIVILLGIVYGWRIYHPTSATISSPQSSSTSQSGGVTGNYNIILINQAPQNEIERIKTQQIQFTITAHPASPTNPKGQMSIPIFIVNQSPQHRIVLSFALCLPLSNGEEYRQHKVFLGEIKPSLGPEEHTSGTLSFFLGSPKDNNITMLFREAYLLVKDLVSSESVKVKIPGKFPPG